MKDNKELYYSLVHEIKQRGIKRDKRHGNYIKVNVYDDYYLDLDTWSKAIVVYQNDKEIDYLGIDFGGFKCNVGMVRFWLAHLILNQQP